jgi:XapX domain-containing protein
MIKPILGLALCFVIGSGCRLFAIPLPSPPMMVGALLVVAMTVGYSFTDTYLAKKPATTKHLCGGPSGETAQPKNSGEVA